MASREAPDSGFGAHRGLSLRGKLEYLRIDRNLCGSSVCNSREQDATLIVHPVEVANIPMLHKVSEARTR